MSQTLFEIESKEYPTASGDEAEASEIVACIAAVSAYIDGVNSEPVGPSPISPLKESRQIYSNWIVAARLENTTRNTIKKKSCQQLMKVNTPSVWRISGRLLSISLLFFATSLCSYSGNRHLAASSCSYKKLQPISVENNAYQKFSPKPRIKKFLERIWFISKGNRHQGKRSSPKDELKADGSEHPIETIKTEQIRQSPKPSFNIANMQTEFGSRGRYPVSIKVALALNSSKINIDAIDGAEIIQAPAGNRVAVLPPGTSWSVGIEGNNLAFYGRSDRGMAYANKPPLGPVEQGFRPAKLPYGGFISAADSFMSNTSTRAIPGAIKQVAYYPALPVHQLDNFKFPLTGSYVPGKNDQLETAQYFIIPTRQESGASVFAVNGKLYRGSLWLKTNGGNGHALSPSLSAINIIELEEYLLSVVPSEMPCDWPSEALKAQAIAARSYAIANMGKHANEGYDVQSGVNDQVYSGIARETEKTNKAVAETEGLVLKHKGEVISAFFHSTAGGVTELAENVWGKSLPYIQSVSDYDDSSPYFSWQRQFRTSEIEAAYARSAQANNIGKLLAVEVISRSSSRRSLIVELKGTRSTQLINGETLRHLLRLPSTIFHVTCDNGIWTFSGHGYGHGVGLSQWGAKALAEYGYNAAQILAYYYKDVALTYLNETPGI